ncbi:hypothetical protein Tco_0423569, partial [Tanacetum coccineum]
KELAVVQEYKKDSSKGEEIKQESKEEVKEKEKRIQERESTVQGKR